MQKFLRTMMLIAALALPFASNAQTQVTADRTYLSQDFSVANPEGWVGGTSNYAPTFQPTGEPSWTYTEYAMNGLAAGHYYYNLFAANRYQWLVSPEMDLTESGRAQLRYDIALTAFSGAVAPADVDSGKTVMVLVRTKASANGNWGAWQTLRKWVKNPAEGELDIAELTAAYTNDTIDFEAYLGTYAQLAFYCENTTSRMSSVNIHVDNVVVDGIIRAQAPSAIAVAEVGTTTATLTWVDGVNPVVHHYQVMAIAGTDTLYAAATDALTFTFAGLQPATSYTFRVRTFINANEADASAWSAASSAAFTHYANPFVVNAENSYTNDFEASAEGWQFVHHTANDVTHGWYYATEVISSHLDTVTLDAYAIGSFILPEDTVYKADESGEIDTAATTWSKANQVNDSVNHVIWVSNDGGLTNAYNPTGARSFYAYMPVQLEAGDYDFSYNWRSRGETGNYDYVRTMLVEENAAITAGVELSSNIFQSDNHRNQATWQDYSNTFTVGSDGIYKLVLMWRNDNSGGNQPPASIDNIVLKKVVCFPVADLAQSAEGTTFAALAMTWTDSVNADATYRIVAIGGGDTIEALVEAPEMPYVLTHDSIKPETNYQVRVYTVCGEGLESHPTAAVTMRTNALCEPVTELAATDVTRSSAVISWVDEKNVDATYDLVVVNGEDTIVNVAGAESGYQLTGLVNEVSYTVYVSAIANEDTATVSTSFTTLCPQGISVPMAYFTVNLTDSYGDGWNGNYLQVLADGEQVGEDYTIASGSSASYTVEVPADANIEFKYVAGGNWQGENSWAVKNAAGETVYQSSSMSSTAVLYTTTSVQDHLMPICDEVALTVEVAERTSDGATFTWEQNLAEDVTGYQVVVKQGNTVVVDETVEADALTYTTTALNPSTNYTVTVGAICEDGFVLENEVPVAFETRGPCNAPENFVATATHASISLSWTQDDPTVETYQLYYTADATLDINTVDEADFVAVSGNEGYTILNLDADVTYTVYFRANCGEERSAWRTATVATVPFVDCTSDGESATVADGTTTNNYVPFYGCYVDSYLQRSQFVYTEAMMGDLVGKTLKSMTFYFGANKNFNVTASFKLGSYESATIDAFDDNVEMTTVWTGNLNTTNYQLVINFAEPYLYEGGNLIVEFASENTGGYSCSGFTGISSTGSSVYGGSYSGVGSGNQQNFLPKVTFGTCGIAPACAAAEVEVSDIDYNVATLNWERPDSKVLGYLLAGTVVTDTVEIADDVTTYALEGIAQNADHTVYLGTVCGEAEGDTAWTSVSFSTPAYCRVAANLTAELTAKNAATLSWESTDTNQAANFSYILATEALTEDSLANYAGAIVSGIAANEAALADLAYGTTYYAYVRNVCTLGDEVAPAPWVGPATFTTMPEMTDVMNLATSVYRNEVTATWEADSASFATDSLWRVAIVGHDSMPTEWETVNEPTMTWTGLAFDTVYDVYVAAFNGTITSDTVMATATIGFATPVVLNLATSVYRNEISATWEKDANGIETQWQVALRHSDDDSTALVWNTVDTTAYTATGLDYETNYNVYVRSLYTDGSNNDSVFVSNVLTGEAMPVVINIVADPLSHNFATISWQSDLAKNAIDDQWNVAIKKHSDTNAAVFTMINHRDTALMYIEASTQYDVYIAAVAGEMTSDTVVFTFTTASYDGVPEFVGTGCVAVGDENSTSTTYYYPVDNYYKYTLSQTIVDAAELGDAKPLQSVSFYYNYQNPVTKKNDVTVWIKHTSKNSFASNTDWETLDGAVEVYHGDFNFSQGWNEIVFNEPFAYDGTSNIVIIVDDNSNGYNGNSYNFRTASCNGYKTIYYHSDSDNRSFNSPGSATGRYENRVVLKLCYDVKYLQDLEVSEITENSAKATWTAGGYETEWQYANTEGTLDESMIETTSEPMVDIEGLEPNKDYTFYVRAIDYVDIYSTPKVAVKDTVLYDTTYSKENPLQMIVTPIYDTTYADLMDTLVATATTAGAFILPTDTVYTTVEPIVIDSTLTVWKVAKVHVDTAFNQLVYSPWEKVEYSTPMTCLEPLTVQVAAASTDSALVLGLALEGNAMNFRYAVKGTDEYVTVPGIDSVYYDTTDFEVRYAPEDIDTIYYGYDENDEEVESAEPFNGYNGETYEWEEPVTSFYTELAEGAEPVDTVYAIDTIDFFYAFLEPLANYTDYVVSAQVVCDEQNASKWSEDVEFTTLYDCGTIVELPYVEGFEDNSMLAGCWNIIVNDTFSTANGEVADGSIYPVSRMNDMLDSQFYDRTIVSPEFNATDSVMWYSWITCISYQNYNYLDTVSFGYSLDGENFVWIDTYTRTTYYGGGEGKTYYLPAGTKRVAYHFVGNYPNAMMIGDVSIRQLEHFDVNIYNAQPTMGTVVMKINDDTLEAAEAYNEDVYEFANIGLTATANDGYRFTGWEVVNAQGKRDVVSTTNTRSFAAADTVMIANFAVNEATVKVAINKSAEGTVKISSHGDTNQFKAATGTSFTLTAVDTVDNRMSFRGWSLNANAENIVSYDSTYTFDLVAMNNNATYTYTAIFVQDSFNVVVNYDNAMGTVTGNGMHPIADSVNITLTATVNHGYEFINWTNAEGEVITTELTFDTASRSLTDLEFNANMQTVPFYVQVASNDENRGTATVDTTAAQYLDTVIFTATPVEGSHSHFLFWKDLVNQTVYTQNPLEYIVVEDANMMAFFDVDSHYVYVVSDKDNYGYVTINGEAADSVLFPYGQQGISLEAMPNTGVAFTAWNDGNTGNPRVIGALEYDTTFTASFDSIVYQIAVNVDDVEGSVENLNGVEGKYLDTLTFVAEANPGYRFVDWTDAEENHYSGDTLHYTITDAENQAVMANFTEAGKVNINLVANILAGGTLTVYGQSTIEGEPVDTNSIDGYIRYDSLSTVTLVAEPAEHYHFLRWMSADTLLSEEETVEVEGIYGDAMYFTAYFEIDSHLVKAVAENGSFLFNGVAADGDSMYTNYGTTVNVAPVLTANHYHFVGWNDGTEDTLRSILVESDTILEATFAIDTHSVTPSVNNELFGTVVVEGMEADENGAYWYNYGDSAYLTAVANTGYHFVNWNTGSTEAEYGMVVMANDAIVANFDTNVYNVTFVAENGTIEGATTVKHFTTEQYVAVPAYGYHFDNWMNVESNTDTAELSAVSDTTIIANFAKNTYTVYAAANDSALGTISEPVSALYLDTVTLYAEAIEGYHVENWSNGMTGDSINVQVTGNDTITANFAINVYNVTAVANFAERGTIAGAKATEHGALDTLVAVANYGYVFEGWNNGVTTDTMVLTVVSDTNVIASFGKAQFSAVAEVNDATMGTAAVNNATANYLDTVVFTATANEHYRFVNWSNGATTDTVSIVLASDTTLTANFEAIMWTVSVSSADETMGTVSPAGDSTVMDGSSFTATATALTGYHFVSWNTGATTASVTVTVDSNIALVATFAQDTTPATPQFSVVLTSANSAMGTVSAGATVDSGSVFTATATANEGYHFVAWIEGVDTVSTDAAYTFTVTREVSLVAHFAADVVVNSYTVTAEVNDAAMGTVTGAGNYEEGAECVLIAHANAGYRFVRWMNGTEQVGNEGDTILTFTVTANITITAVFEQNDGIENVDMSDVTIYSTDSKIVVRGAENQSIYVFDVNGRVITSEANAAETCEFRMSNTGVYLVKVGNAPAKRVLVVR